MSNLTSSTVRIPVSALSVVHPAPRATAWEKDASVLAEVLATAGEPVLRHLMELLTAQLHQQAASLSNEEVSVMMRLIARLDEQREEAELAASPARRAGLARLKERLAYEGRLTV